MIIPCIKFKEYSEPLIVGINPIISSDEVYDVVINHASKASEEYVGGEMWFDATSPFMRARINVEEMLMEINKLFYINLSHEEIKKCAGYIMHTIDYIASEYVEKHAFLKKFIGSKRVFPEADVNYAIVILAFERYINILFSISLEKKDITYKNMINIITFKSAPTKYNRQIDRMIIDLDSIVMSHRKFISEQDLEE